VGETKHSILYYGDNLSRPFSMIDQESPPRHIISRRMQRMKSKIIYIILTAMLLTLITHNNTFSDSCKCEFNTDVYEATAFYTGACNYTMDSTRTKCTIREAGNYLGIEKSLIREDKFGNPLALRAQFSPIIQALAQNRPIQATVDPQKFFPFLLRPSYLAAPFLEEYQKRTMDDILLRISGRYGKEMLNIFWGFAGRNSFVDKEVTKEKHEMTIGKGIARLIVDFSGREILVCARL
jgi:hypothetical protein